MGSNTTNTVNREQRPIPTTQPTTTRTNNPNRNKLRQNPTPARDRRLYLSPRNKTPKTPRRPRRTPSRLHPRPPLYSNRNPPRLGTSLHTRSNKPRNRSPKLKMQLHPLHSTTDQPRSNPPTPPRALNNPSRNGDPPHKPRYKLLLKHR
jgi:hypothetical protein